MALIPVSYAFEIFFAMFAWILLERASSLSKMAAIGLWTFEIPLLTLNQQFYTDSGGTLALVSIAFPSAISAYVIFGIVIVWIYMMYNAFAYITDQRE
jgi:hypothetical protein